MAKLTDLELLRRFIGGLFGPANKGASQRDTTGEPQSDSEWLFDDCLPFG